MENPEEVLQSLDEFAKLKPKDIPRELEDYLSYVAKTGDPVYQWSIVKCLFREKLLNVITDFYETSPTIDLPPCPNVDPFNYETMKNSLLERLDSFPSAPFTVQRLCELLTTPRKEYSRADKFMRAIEKNILVVSTREPGNVRRSDNNGQPELLMNGVMDGRGIELGEAIETVSSDGVNLMHSDENEVNVTENENVPVECAGMEEIDMEEQGDHMEPSNSNVWEKEQSEVSVQSEEDEGLKNYDSNSGEGENKSKETSGSFEVSSTEGGESARESAELSVAAEIVENVVDSISEAVPGDSHAEPDTSSSSSKDHLDKMDENSDQKAEENLMPEAPTEEDKTPKPENEETVESVPPDEAEAVPETSTASEQEPVSNSSPAENLSKGSSNTETEPVTGNSNDETVPINVVSETESLEPAASSEETTCKTDSTNTEIPPVEICAKSVDTGVTPTENDATEVTNTNSEQLPADVISTEESEKEAPASSPPTEAVPCEEATENDTDSKTEQLKDEGVAVCQQDEAMEVDENNVSSQLVSADVDEPMDQSEQTAES